MCVCFFFFSLTHNSKLGSMFKGILSPVIGLAGLNAVLFVSYGSILRCFEQPDKSPNLWDVYLAGTGAGFACFLISTPTDLVKIKAQMTKFPKTSLQITKEIHQTNGLKGYYIHCLYNVYPLFTVPEFRFLSRRFNYHDP